MGYINRVMTKVLQKRDGNDRSVSFICDFSPPSSPDEGFLEEVLLIEADFISVACNPGKTVKTHSVIGAYWIKEKTSKDVVFTVATRDLNKIATQSLLLGASLLGLDNLVVVKGDKFTQKDLLDTQEVNDFSPTELIYSVSAMNMGKDYKGTKLTQPTDFCIGASIDLGSDITHQITLTQRKLDAGAQYFLLQAVFDPQIVVDFVDIYEETYGLSFPVPIYCGIQIMKNNSLSFSEVPYWVGEDLKRGRSGEEIAIEILERFIEKRFNAIYLIPPIIRGGSRDYGMARRVINAVKLQRL